MSLDVYLTDTTAICSTCGHSHECKTQTVYGANVTHNLGGIASAAGIYYALWRPEEIGIKTAGELVPLLESGLVLLKGNPAMYIKLNPENGWGSYEGFVPWVEQYLDACRKHPNATIRVSR